MSIAINWGVWVAIVVCQQQRRWSEAPLEEMMGKMHCYAIAIASCFHWIVKSLCWSSFFYLCCFCSLLFCRLRCGVRRLELHWLSEFFTLVQWWWWSWTVELSRLPEVIHCCSHIGELVCACQIWINWLQLKKTIYNETKQSSGFEQMMFELQCSNGAKPWTISKRSQT